MRVLLINPELKFNFGFVFISLKSEIETKGYSHDKVIKNFTVFCNRRGRDIRSASG